MSATKERVLRTRDYRLARRLVERIPEASRKSERVFGPKRRRPNVSQSFLPNCNKHKQAAVKCNTADLLEKEDRDMYINSFMSCNQSFNRGLYVSLTRTSLLSLRQFTL